MTISIVRKADIVAAIPDLWAEQYRTGASASQREITEKLAALKGTDFTDAQCTEIIGNSWGRNQCAECGGDHGVLVRIGDEPDYESRWVDLCADCLAKATTTLNNEPAAAPVAAAGWESGAAEPSVLPANQSESAANPAEGDIIGTGLGDGGVATSLELGSEGLGFVLDREATLQRPAPKPIPVQAGGTRIRHEGSINE